MIKNPGYAQDVHQVQPQGKNSTMFTMCCDVVICDDQPCCPVCRRTVIGHNAETAHARGRVRWEHATRHWDRKSLGLTP